MRECSPRTLESHVSCMRNKWIANLTAFVHARRKMPRCAHPSIGGKVLVSHLCANVSAPPAPAKPPKKARLPKGKKPKG